MHLGVILIYRTSKVNIYLYYTYCTKSRLCRWVHKISQIVDRIRRYFMYKWKINLIKSAISKLWSHSEYLCRTFCTKSQFVYPCNIEIWFKRSSMCWCYDTRDISKDLTFNLVMNNALNFGRRFICETRKEINVFSLAMFKLKHGKVTFFCVDIAAAFNSCMWGHNLHGVLNYAKNVNWKKITTSNPTIHSHLFSNGSVIFYRLRVKFFCCIAINGCMCTCSYICFNSRTQSWYVALYLLLDDRFTCL